MAAIVSGAGKVSGRGPGRPGKPKMDVAAFIAAATAATSGKAVKGTGAKRGPKPKIKVEETPAPRKKRVMSEEGRRRIIEAQKKRWAARKKGK
ncbi:MAG: hypothetical protein ACAI34_15330 [Verrucomicrobium sp.]